MRRASECLYARPGCSARAVTKFASDLHKLGLTRTHHNLSHVGDKDGQLEFAKYDLFLSQQLAHFFGKLQAMQDREGSVLDNTIVLYGSGASTTHTPRNLPTLVVGGNNLGLRHGKYLQTGESRMANLYLSILHSLGVATESFADSNGKLATDVFTKG